MSALTDAANAIVAAIKAGESSNVTAEHVAAIDASIASEATDIADLKAAFQVLSDGLAPAAPATPPAPAPEAAPAEQATS